MRKLSSAIALGLAFAGGVFAPLACSGDLFHGTSWPSECDDDPSTAGCPGAGGAKSSSSSSKSTSHSSAHSSSSKASSSSGMDDDAGDGGDGGETCDAGTYQNTSGAQSGTTPVTCCNGDDALVDIQDCATGMSHFVQPVGANCAQGSEGAMNGGDCCVTVVCAYPCDAGTMPPGP